MEALVDKDRAPCCLCGGTESSLLVTGYDRMEARAEEYRYRRCSRCGLVSISPFPAPDVIPTYYPEDYHACIAGCERNLDKPINRLAIRYLYGVESVSRHRALRAAFRACSSRTLKGIREPRGANRLLDVGCGTGNALATYRRLGWSVCGVETSEGACRACWARSLEVHHATLFDAPLAGRQFDIVLMSHVIEHVLQPAALLRRAAELLAPGGRIVVLTPNIRSLGFALYGSCWFPLDAPRHVFLFDPETLRRLGTQAGVRLRTLRTPADPQLLSESRHYARTQGMTLPPDLSRRQVLLRESRRRKQSHRAYRELMTPLAFLAARCGRGDVIEAEFGGD
jgi:SAM-dependent methyltransferase